MYCNITKAGKQGSHHIHNKYIDNNRCCETKYQIDITTLHIYIYIYIYTYIYIYIYIFYKLVNLSVRIINCVKGLLTGPNTFHSNIIFIHIYIMQAVN